MSTGQSVPTSIKATSVSLLNPTPRAASSQTPYTCRLLASIRELDADDAKDLFGDDVEGSRYLEACENAERGTPLRTAMLAVYRADAIVAAAPLVQITQRLDMTFPASVRAVGDMVYKIAPSTIAPPFWCLGTRTSVECPLGFRSTLTPEERDEAFSMLLAGLARHASEARVKLLGLKCLTDQDARWAHGLLSAAGYVRMPTPPTAVLHLPFADEAGYLASLSYKMRKDFRKKIKGFNDVEVEIRHTFEGIEKECIELLEATKAKKRTKTDYGEFSEVPHSYLSEITKALGSRTIIVLTRVDGILTSFSLSMIDRDRFILAYLGMRYPLAQERDIYFLNWITCVRYCLEHRISWLHAGVSTYHVKVRFGCKLQRCWTYFKYTGPVIGPVLRRIVPHIRIDAMDPDLAAFGKDAPYLSPDVATGLPLRPLHNHA